MNRQQRTEETIFDFARQIASPRERAAYVERACQGRPELLARIRRLLEAGEGQDHFFERGFSDLSETAIPELAERPGMEIRGYRLMEQIGEGGMGIVFVAEQSHPIRRRVALKVIKPGMDTHEVIARFEAERQALAMMDHPNIAKVYDAGTTETGRPYFAMELVHGVSVTEYCRLNKLDTAMRLQLFQDVCYAVQHAHQKGVIHRDIKPSNVLVTEHDGTPVVKVIDFGVAKAVNQQLTQRTVYTRFHQMVGTPLYMSPEQAELSGLDVDTRSDVYSLGVLLYELLTGTTPFDRERMRKAALDELRRIIREEEPSKPSTKVRSLGKTAMSVSAYQRTDPDRLSKALSGDLDWIVMKSLEKDRNRRYDTAKDLAADIARHMKDEPIDARPPSAAYRLQKMARRNKVACAAIAAVTMSMLIGMAVAFAGWTEARRSAVVARENERAAQEERKSAETERDRADTASMQLRQQVRHMFLGRVAEADRAFLLGDYHLAHDILGTFPAAHRGWGWRYVHARVERTITNRFKACEQPYFSKDGQYLIAIGEHNTTEQKKVKRWELGSGHTSTLLSHDVPLSSVAIADDENTIVAGDARGNLLVWDTGSAEKRWQKNIHDASFDGLAISPNGAWIASANRDRTLKVIKASDGSVVFSKGPFAETKRTRKVMFSPDSRWVVGGAYRGEVPAMLIESATGRVVSTFSEGGGDYAPTFDPSGQRIATANRDGSVTIWHWDAQQLVARKTWHVCEDPLRDIDFSPDGARLVSCDYSRRVRVWNVADGREIAAFNNAGYVYWSKFSRTGNEIALYGANLETRIWRYAAHKPNLTVRPLGSYADVSFSPNSKQLLVSTPMGYYVDPPPQDVAILDVETGAEMRRFADEYYAARWSPNGGRIVASSAEGEGICVFDVDSGECVRKYPVQLAADHSRKNKPRFVAQIDADGRRLVCFSLDGRLRGIERSSGKEFPIANTRSTPPAAAISRDSRFFAIHQKSGLEVWDTRTGMMIGRHALPTAASYNIRFSLDGRRVYAGGQDGLLLEFDVEQQNEKRFLGRTDNVTATAVSPDGQKLASASAGQVTVWDVESLQKLVTLLDGNQVVSGLDWSRDGRRVAAGTEDGTVHIWELD